MIGSVRHRPDETNHKTVAELTKRASEQLSDVVRSEMRLAQAEMKEKGKRAGFGGGMFGGAAIMGLLALWALVFASALIVAGGLLLVAGVLAVAGRHELGSAGPPKPERTIDSVKADVDAIREGAHR
jgi:Flp pilus assembly protein TadB